MIVQEAIPIYGGQDFYVPNFEIRMGERPLDASVVRDVMQVTYKDAIGAIDSVQIKVNDWDAESRALKWIDLETFDPGKEFELWMGYYGQDGMRRMLAGEITSLGPTFPASGQPTLAVTGLNLLHRFRTEQVSQAYEGQTDSQIAKQIAVRLGVDIVTNPLPFPPEPTYGYLLQDNQYDVVFLMERAQRVGYDLFVMETDEPSLYFGPSVSLQRPTYKLTYGRSLIQFKPTLTTANQVGEVIVRGWDAMNKKKIEAKATRKDLATEDPKVGDRPIDSSFNKRKEVIADRPIADEAEARQLALETLQNIAKDMVKGSGSVVGLPDLRAGSILYLEGLGERFNGRYFVTGTTHTIGNSGYTTQFDCRKEELS